MENTNVTTQATSTSPVTRIAPPKNTLKVDGVHGLEECKMRDGGMFSLLVDTSRHEAFKNAKGDVETIVKMSGVKVGEYTVNMTVKRVNAEEAARKQAKNISDKLKKYAKGKATEGDIVYLLAHGFANEQGDGLDEAKCEAYYADILAAQAKITASKAFQEMRKNNGSLAQDKVAGA